MNRCMTENYQHFLTGCRGNGYSIYSDPGVPSSVHLISTDQASCLLISLASCLLLSSSLGYGRQHSYFQVSSWSTYMDLEDSVRNVSLALRHISPLWIQTAGQRTLSTVESEKKKQFYPSSVSTTCYGFWKMKWFCLLILHQLPALSAPERHTHHFALPPNTSHQRDLIDWHQAEISKPLSKCRHNTSLSSALVSCVQRRAV